MKKPLLDVFKRIGGLRLNESVLGDLPSSKLMKMKVNTVTVSISWLHMQN